MSVVRKFRQLPKRHGKRLLVPPSRSPRFAESAPLSTAAAEDEGPKRGRRRLAAQLSDDDDDDVRRASGFPTTSAGDGPKRGPPSPDGELLDSDDDFEPHEAACLKREQPSPDVELLESDDDVAVLGGALKCARIPMLAARFPLGVLTLRENAFQPVPGKVSERL